MGNFLYSIIIYPLYQIIEFFYSLCDAVVKSPGLSVIGVSFAVSFLCLPLYIIAERWQELERNTQKALKPGVDRIKAVFKGDEQYMILTTYYRQHHYHPAMALRSSLSLLIQIPFFIAAYNFLSHLEILQGYSFLFIKDMGAPDAIFQIGNFNVNILPIAMTIINIIAGVIYSKGHPVSEKVQIYVMALFFLVFLYNSPSGLVLYWTLNNVFSLIKNIFYKMKNPLKVLYFCLVIAIIGTDYYLLFKHTGFFYRRLTLVIAVSLLLFIPLIVKGINWLLNNPLKTFVEENKKRTICFILSCITLALLAGFTIPSFLISSSPVEFSFIDGYDSPFYFIRNTLYQSIGFFIFWPCCLYFLFSKKIQSLFSILFSTILIGGVINAFIFSGNYGFISTGLTFSDTLALKPTMKFLLLNLLSLAIVIIGIFLLYHFNKTQIVTYCLGILFSTLFIITIVNSSKISKGYNDVVAQKATEDNVVHGLDPIFHLSKDNKNVLLIMEDRAMGPMMPYLLEENPNLYSQYDGFVYYENTVSMGQNTISGSPALYGGYEYTTENLNRRANEALIDKHNESLKVLPVMFLQNGFETTVTDMSWANYSWISDLSIYDDYPEIHRAKNKGVYNSIWMKKNPNQVSLVPRSGILKRNLIWFSFFKIMPCFLRETIYEEGHWWAIKSSTEEVSDFLNTYAVLDLLPELTDTTADKPTFTILVNEATHEPVITGYPNYDLSSTDCGPSIVGDDKMYQSFGSAIYRIGEFLDYLREQGVYDNTRIIIVADHGGTSKLDKINPDYPYYKYRPLLMFKDFNSHGNMEISCEFMTNADAPYLATKDIIDNPINPFTGNLITDFVNKDKVFISHVTGWAPEHHDKNILRIDDWYSVHDNADDINNWKNESPFDEGEDK